jgi:methyltransferase (TIGR00027 family)
MNESGSNLRPSPDISTTAFGMAIGRAIETERADAHFCDPFARQLGGTVGEQFLKKLGSPTKGLGLAIAVRTCLIDQFVTQLVEQNKVDTVLNLAAGLDTRPYRMALPPTLRWIEVDRPAILTYKQTQLATAQPVCSVQSIPLDLTNIVARNELFAQVNAEASQVLVITEGLLAYLSPVEVGALAADLRQQPKFEWWLTELASPILVKVAQRLWYEQLEMVQARLQFAPSQGAEFFRPYGWQMQQFRSLLQAAHRLNRDVPFGWLLRHLPLIQDGVVLLERLCY